MSLLTAKTLSRRPGSLTEDQMQEERRREELESAALAQLRAEEYRKAYGLDDEPYYEDMLTEEQIEDLRREKEEEAILTEIRAQEARDEPLNPSDYMTPEEIQMMLEEAEIERGCLKRDMTIWNSESFSNSMILFISILSFPIFSHVLLYVSSDCKKEARRPGLFIAYCLHCFF